MIDATDHAVGREIAEAERHLHGAIGLLRERGHDRDEPTARWIENIEIALKLQRKRGFTESAPVLIIK